MKDYYIINNEKLFDTLKIKYNIFNQTYFLLKSILKYLQENKKGFESYKPENKKQEIYINSYLYDLINFLESIYIYDIDIEFLLNNKILKKDIKSEA